MLNYYKIIFTGIENTATFPLKIYNESKLEIKLDEKYKWYKQVVRYNKITKCIRCRSQVFSYSIEVSALLWRKQLCPLSHMLLH